MSMVEGALMIAERYDPDGQSVIGMAAKLLASEVRRLRAELENERRLREAEIDDGK